MPAAPGVFSPHARAGGRCRRCRGSTASASWPRWSRRRVQRWPRTSASRGFRGGRAVRAALAAGSRSRCCPPSPSPGAGSTPTSSPPCRAGGRGHAAALDRAADHDPGLAGRYRTRPGRAHPRDPRWSWSCPWWSPPSSWPAGESSAFGALAGCWCHPRSRSACGSCTCRSRSDGFNGAGAFVDRHGRQFPKLGLGDVIRGLLSRGYLPYGNWGLPAACHPARLRHAGERGWCSPPAPAGESRPSPRRSCWCCNWRSWSARRPPA